MLSRFPALTHADVRRYLTARFPEAPTLDERAASTREALRGTAGEPG